MPIVSVCIPVYNVEKYIQRCIESVQSQSIEDIEIIIVDDCSPDNSIVIAKQLTINDKRIKIIALDNNSGLMFARRAGYMEAKGDFVCFCDSDDALPEKSLEKLVSAAQVQGADIVIGNINYIGDSPLHFNTTLKYGSDKISVYKSLLRREATHNLCGKLFKRELLQGYPYKTYLGCTNSEDLGAFYQIINNSKKVISIDEDVYCYYQNEMSSSQIKYSDKAFDSMFLMRNTAIEVLSQYPQLANDMKKWLVRDLVTLFPRYNRGGYLKDKLKDYGLYSYLSIRNIIRLFKLSESLGYIVKVHYPFHDKFI